MRLLHTINRPRRLLQAWVLSTSSISLCIVSPSLAASPSEAPAASASGPAPAAQQTLLEEQAKAPLDAGETASPPTIEVVVQGDAPPSAASEEVLTGGELQRRPRRRPGDLVEAAPGLISVQHAGGGKANQYFLRGFDIDHGTDLAIDVDGVGVNFPSHGHGQGYADLHFLIPELVSKLTVYKGPYSPQFGDFATVGALHMDLADSFAESRASAGAGNFGIRRGLAIVPLELGASTQSLLAAELYQQDGPFVHAEHLRRTNLFARVRQDLSPLSSVKLTWMSYAASWNASGQIPLRAVQADELDRFGSVDPSEGGATQRHSATLDYEAQFEDAQFRLTLYGIRYDWRLYSNFTFFLEDPVHGDQIEQVDSRDVAGLHARVTTDASIVWGHFRTGIGVQARADAIANGLHHDEGRARLETRSQSEIAQSALGVYLDEWARFLPWLAFHAGMRVDRADVAVSDRRLAENDQPRREGTASGTLLSPKLSMILSPSRSLDLFVNYGRGFHSNDARGAVAAVDPADLLVAASGYEVGARLRWAHLADFGAAVYLLDVNSEQVYVGDAGTTEPSDPSRRYGLELTARLNPLDWLHADAQVTFNRAAYRSNEGNAGAIALAPTRTATGGVGVDGPFGGFGSVRVRHVGERPATEDGSLRAAGFSVFSALLGHRYGPVQVELAAENIFDAQWREVQFATESRLDGEAEGVEEIHFAPGWPRTVTLTVSAFL